MPFPTATWVKRCQSEDDPPEKSQMILSSVQQDKLRYFFHQLLDGDHDELISYNDFHNLAEVGMVIYNNLFFVVNFLSQTLHRNKISVIARF